MNIKLIHPTELDDNGKPVKYRHQLTPGLTLPYLAALFPRDAEIELIEDGISGVNFDDHADLVGITVTTAHAPRAYIIGDEYKRRGVKVVMGGFHPSFFPDEALAHCDAVVVGEAEGLIEDILNDLKTGSLKHIYSRDYHHDLKGLPAPRFDLIKYGNYQLPFSPIQTSRGCPHGCRFCSVTRYWGKTYRHRPVEDVLRDIEAAGNYLIFTDDNFTANKEYAGRLLDSMIPLKKNFFAQCNIDIASDEEFLKRMKNAGAACLYIGIESLNKTSLGNMGKGFNKPELYSKAIKTIEKQGMIVMASMIVGFDEDGPETFDEIFKFLEENRITAACLYILTPFPGTKLYDRFREEGRLLTDDWRYFTAHRVVFRPKRMTAEELNNLYWETNKRFYSLPSMMKRLLIPPHPTWFLHNILTKEKIKYRLHALQGEPAETSYGFVTSIYGMLINSKLLIETGKKLTRILR